MYCISMLKWSGKKNMQSTKPVPRPTTADRQAWRAYWVYCQQAWRIEPEISSTRQRELTVLRNRPADSEKGIYPFQKQRLSRADVEWLLATHEQGRGPVLPRDVESRTGLDLRGANLAGAHLAGLPLTGFVGSLVTVPPGQDEYEARKKAAVHLEGANLSGTHLEYAHLEGVHMEGACLEHACLQSAYLDGAYLEDANLRHADCFEASLDGAWLWSVHGEEARLWCASMREAQFFSTHLERADLSEARLDGAELMEVFLEGANLKHACLAGATLYRVYFDYATQLLMVDLGDDARGLASLSHIRWGEADIDGISWSRVSMLGNEVEAALRIDHHGEPKSLKRRRGDYRGAITATRQLARALQAQGFDEEAAYFALRARRLERTLFFLRGRWGAFLYAQFSDWFNAYGYRSERGFFWLIIGVIILLILRRKKKRPASR
jgi:uncharacterized protein YjbI with pentapeptide repeats